MSLNAPTAIDFDTLSYSQQLIEAGFTSKQAEIQAKTLKKIIESNLATKQDILNLQKDIANFRTELQKDISDTKAEIIKWVAGMLVAQAAIVATMVKLL